MGWFCPSEKCSWVAPIPPGRSCPICGAVAQEYSAERLIDERLVERKLEGSRVGAAGGPGMEVGQEPSGPPMGVAEPRISPGVPSPAVPEQRQEPPRASRMLGAPEPRLVEGAGIVSDYIGQNIAAFLPGPKGQIKIEGRLVRADGNSLEVEVKKGFLGLGGKTKVVVLSRQAIAGFWVEE